MKLTISLFITFIGLALTINFNNQWYIIPPILIIIFIVERQAFLILFRWKFLVFLAILLFGTPVFLGKKDAILCGILYSLEYFEMSIVMLQRSIIILLSIKMFTNRISINQISNGLKNLKLYKFGEVFSISMRVLPEIRLIILKSIEEFRQKPRKSNIFSELFGWAVNLMSQILNYANQYNRSDIEQPQ